MGKRHTIPQASMAGGYIRRNQLGRDDDGFQLDAVHRAQGAPEDDRVESLRDQMQMQSTELHEMQEMITNVTRELARLQQRALEQYNSPSVRSRTSQAAFHDHQRSKMLTDYSITTYKGLDMEIEGKKEDTPKKTIPSISSCNIPTQIRS